MKLALTCAFTATIIFFTQKTFAQKNYWKPSPKVFYNFRIDSDTSYNEFHHSESSDVKGKSFDRTYLYFHFKRVNDIFYSTGVFLDKRGTYNYCVLLALPYSSFDLGHKILVPRDDMKLDILRENDDAQPVAILNTCGVFEHEISYYDIELKSTVYAFAIPYPYDARNFQDMSTFRFRWPREKDKQGGTLTFNTIRVHSSEYREITIDVRKLPEIIRVLNTRL